MRVPQRMLMRVSDPNELYASLMTCMKHENRGNVPITFLRTLHRQVWRLVDVAFRVGDPHEQKARHWPQAANDKTLEPASGQRPRASSAKPGIGRTGCIRLNLGKIGRAHV